MRLNLSKEKSFTLRHESHGKSFPKDPYSTPDGSSQVRIELKRANLHHQGNSHSLISSGTKSQHLRVNRGSSKCQSTENSCGPRCELSTTGTGSDPATVAPLPGNHGTVNTHFLNGLFLRHAQITRKGTQFVTRKSFVKIFAKFDFRFA